MGKHHKTQSSSAERLVRDIKRKTRKQYGAEEKIRIVLDGLRGEDSIADICRREGISQKLHQRLSDKFVDLDLRISDASILVLIKENAGITQSQIGQELDIARANMAPIISKMEKLGLVTKSPIDGRSFGLFLTDHGERVYNFVIETMKQHEAYIISAFDESDVNTFTDFLAVLYQKIVKHNSSHTS